MPATGNGRGRKQKGDNGLELKGFVPAAFATSLETQIWETGLVTDPRGANTLPGVSGCCPGSGERVQSCWAGCGSLSPAGAVPWRGALTPLRSAPVAQLEPDEVALPLRLWNPGWHGTRFASSWGGKHDHNKGGFNVNTLLQLILKLPLQL